MLSIRSKDGTTIAYSKIGDGPVLILVDGALCHRKQGPMTDLAQELAGRFTVITYDRRGRGESDDTLTYAVEREVEDLAALVSVMGESAFAFGVDTGAALILRACAAGVAIFKIALYEPFFVIDEDARKQIVEDKAKLEKLLSEGKESAAIAHYLTKFRGMSVFVANMLRMSEWWKRVKVMAHTLQYDSEVMGDYLLPAERLKRISVPAMLVSGVESPSQFQASTEAVADAICSSRLVYLDSLTPELNPNSIAPFIEQFFLSTDDDDSSLIG
jgi:pimeloyl-ACP methyl ester carboxylesterase